MNRIKNSAIRRSRSLISALALIGFSLAPSAPAAPPASSDWLWLSSTVNGCTWSATVQWAGFKQAKTLEVFVTEGYYGSALVPEFVALSKIGKTGTASVTLEPLAPSATINNFYVWAQLLDSHGVAIPSSLDFASVSPAYCTAP